MPEPENSGLNPLLWKRQHLVIWALLMMLGAAAGLAFGWALSPFPATTPMFFAWLHYPNGYWPYVLAGAGIAGGAYYSGDLLTGAR